MSKARIVKLLNILQKKTDFDHPLTAEALIGYLQQEGEEVERKTIYTDIRNLNEAGHDIEYRQENNVNGYYYDSFLFEKSELRAIVEALNACNYITEEKTNEMIEKLLSLINEKEGEDILETARYRHYKTTNKSIFYNIDSIQEAILHKKAVSFRYFDFSLNNEKVYRKKGSLYTIVPYFTVQNNDRLYVIGYSLADEQIRHYRVDRMDNVTVTDDSYVEDTTDINDYVNQHFEMFKGESVTVSLRCDNALSGEVLDKFGEDIIITRREEDFFEFSARISESVIFYSWIYKLGAGIRLLGPQTVIEGFKNYSRQVLERYE